MEHFEDWLTGLKVLVSNCEYSSLEERMLRSRIILGTADKPLQQKLISNNPTFAKVLEMCRTKECSQQQSRKLPMKEKGLTSVMSMQYGKLICAARNMVTHSSKLIAAPQKVGNATNVGCKITSQECVEAL